MLINVNKSTVVSILIILVLLIGGAISTLAAPFTPIALTTVAWQVNSSANDAEEKLNSGNVNLTSPDLKLGVDNHTAQLVGMRFTNITIPRNAMVISAYVEFEVAATDSNTTSLKIRG